MPYVTRSPPVSAFSNLLDRRAEEPSDTATPPHVGPGIDKWALWADGTVRLARKIPRGSPAWEEQYNRRNSSKSGNSTGSGWC
jgi:hypothetical protein